jgi:hypothetical protein
MRIGLHTAKAEVGKVEDIDYLLIQRYDRIALQGCSSGPEYLERRTSGGFLPGTWHHPDNKYQNEGGPSLKAVLCVAA